MNYGHHFAVRRGGNLHSFIPSLCASVAKATYCIACVCVVNDSMIIFVYCNGSNPRTEACVLVLCTRTAGQRNIQRLSHHVEAGGE